MQGKAAKMFFKLFMPVKMYFKYFFGMYKNGNIFHFSQLVCVCLVATDIWLNLHFNDTFKTY